MRRVEENSSILVCISRLAKITTCFREIGEISPSSILSPPLVNLYPFIYLSQMVEKQHHLCQNFQSTGCFFERFHPEKFLVYGIGPSQQDKIAKYTGQRFFTQYLTPLTGSSVKLNMWLMASTTKSRAWSEEQ